MWYIYTIEYYSAVKNNGIMKFAGKWMELEKINMNEVPQNHKDKHSMYSFTSGHQLLRKGYSWYNPQMETG